LSKLIDLQSYPVSAALRILLQDKTTKKNIIWATDAYQEHGATFSDTSQITKGALLGLDSIVLQPRIEKALVEQQERTRKKAEVFTPVWLCNLMNNHCDDEWFGRKGVFNTLLEDHQWIVTEEKIKFPTDKTWQEYVDSRRLEITCGEAPYLVSRYDVSSGEFILPLQRRIGILDRKLRIVNENAAEKDDWIKWAIRAFQSCYGYEYQGDSLLIARINLLLTFSDYYSDRWGSEPDVVLVRRIANIVAWNIWQMDGLNDTVPYGKLDEEYHQNTLFELLGWKELRSDNEAVACRIMNWRSKESCVFRNYKR